VRDRSAHLLAGALFVGLALWIGAPVVSDPGGLLLGHPRNDGWNHVWGFWFVADALLGGRAPLHTALLNWPTGGTLWFIDAFNAVLTLPVQIAFGPVAAVNAALVFNFALCGFGAYALALRVTRSIPGALVAGLAFESTPQLLGQAYNGISETLSAGWLPLALLAVRHACRSGRPNNAALAGAAVAIATLANWYYGLFALLACAGLLLRVAWRHVVLCRQRDRLVLGPPAVRGLRALVIGGAVAAALVLPVYAAFNGSLSAEDAVVTRDPSFVRATLVLHNMTDLKALFWPGKFYSPDLKATFGEDLIVVIYLGWALLLAGLAAIPLVGRVAVSWAALAAGYTLLALGPFLYIAGDYITVGSGWIPLPFLALFEWFPAFSRISHAYRFGVGATLALCVMAAWTIAALRSRGWPAPLLVLVFGGGRVLESLYGSAAVFPLPVAQADVPEVYATIAADNAGAVLDLPVGVPVLARSQYAFYQVHHGHPSPYGLNDPMPQAIWLNRFTRFLVELEWSTISTLPAGLPWLDILAGRQAAIAGGLRWVVVHEGRMQPPQHARLLRFLELVAVPVGDSDGARLYRLDPELPVAPRTAQP